MFKVRRHIIKEVKIRKAIKSDALKLSELFRVFINDESDIKAMSKRIGLIENLPNYYVAVAHYKDEILGTAMGIVCYDLVGSCQQFLLIENVVVSPKYENKGVGKLLMSSLEQFALEQECKYAILVSGTKWENAHKFYESLGYSKEYGYKKKF